MGCNSQHTLAFTSPRRSCRHGGSQATLVLGNRALGVPATAIETLWETIKHSFAIAACGSEGPWAARVDRDHRGGDAEFFSARAMVPLGIVRAITEEPVDRQVSNGLSDRGNEVRCIVARAVAYFQRGNQVAGMMRDDGQFGKTAKLLHAARASQKVAADVVAFQAGGVDRGLGTLLDQAAFMGNTENSGEEPFKSPFFRSRSCAF